MKDSNRYRLAVILASSTLTVMAGAVIAPAVNLIRDGLRVDPALAGLIITTHGIFIALFSPLWGSIIDRIGVRLPFALGLVLYGMAGGSGLLIGSFPTLLVARAILGISVAAIFTSITVAILNLYQGDMKDKVMGWRGSANTLGAVAWPLVGGALGTFSWHFPFGVYLVGIPLGALVLATIQEVRRDVAGGEASEGSALGICNCLASPLIK